MKATDHLFDISSHDKRRETLYCITNILYEIYLEEDEVLQQLVYDEAFSSSAYFEFKHITDTLLDEIFSLAHLYD